MEASTSNANVVNSLEDQLLDKEDESSLGMFLYKKGLYYKNYFCCIENITITKYIKLYQYVCRRYK